MKHQPLSEHESVHYLPDHVSINWFAQAKKVYPNSVYSAIQKGTIVVDTIGREHVRMIDFKVYKDFEFAVRKPSDDKLDAFYERKGQSLASQGIPSPRHGGRKRPAFLLSSVGCAIDTKLLTYPLLPDGAVDRQGLRVPLAQRPPEWWQRLSMEDQRTIAALQAGDVPGQLAPEQ